MDQILHALADLVGQDTDNTFIRADVDTATQMERAEALRPAILPLIQYLEWEMKTSRLIWTKLEGRHIFQDEINSGVIRHTTDLIDILVRALSEGMTPDQVVTFFYQDVDAALADQVQEVTPDVSA